MFREMAMGGGKRRRRVLLTAVALGLVALAFYVGTFLLRHYGMY